MSVAHLLVTEEEMALFKARAAKQAGNGYLGVAPELVDIVKYLNKFDGISTEHCDAADPDNHRCDFYINLALTPSGLGKISQIYIKTIANIEDPQLAHHVHLQVRTLAFPGQPEKYYQSWSLRADLYEPEEKTIFLQALCKAIDIPEYEETDKDD